MWRLLHSFEPLLDRGCQNASSKKMWTTRSCRLVLSRWDVAASPGTPATLCPDSLTAASVTALACAIVHFSHRQPRFYLRVSVQRRRSVMGLLGVELLESFMQLLCSIGEMRVHCSFLCRLPSSSYASTPQTCFWGAAYGVISHRGGFVKIGLFAYAVTFVVRSGLV